MNLFDHFKGDAPQPGQLAPFIRGVERRNGVRIVRLQGPMVKEVAAMVQDALQHAAQEKDVLKESVLFDFARATEVDCTTVAYLVESLRQRMASNARVGILNPSPELTAEIELAKLGGMFTLYKSEDHR